MSKVVDLQKYCDKIASSPIDIEDMDFVQNMSASFHHYCEALRMGFDIKDKTDGPFVLSEDVLGWIKGINIEQTEEPDE